MSVVFLPYLSRDSSLPESDAVGDERDFAELGVGQSTSDPMCLKRDSDKKRHIKGLFDYLSEGEDVRLFDDYLLPLAKAPIQQTVSFSS